MGAFSSIAGRAAAASLAAAVCLLAAGCGSSSSTAGSRSTVTVTATPTTSPATSSPAPVPTSSAPAAPGQCATASLKVAVGSGSGTAGSVDYPLNFTNTSSATCTLYGYPGVSFVTSSGTQIGAPASKNRTTKKATVTVAPGAVAHATLQIAEAGNYPASRCGHIVNVSSLKVFPPNQYTAVIIPITTQACSSKSLVTMNVSTISAGT